MKLLRTNSLRRRFTLGMTIVISVIMLSFSSGLILYNSRTIEKELNDHLNELMILSKGSLANALWQYNDDYVKSYIESLFLYKDLVFVSVMNLETEIGQKVHPKFQQLFSEDFRGSRKFIVAESEILYKQVRVGKIKLIVSRERIVDQIFMTSAISISLLLVLILSIFGTNFFLSRKFLFEPLAKLEATAEEIAGGNIDAAIDVSSPYEIGRLAKTFKRMMHQIKSITASRDELNQEIAERKEAETQRDRLIRDLQTALTEVKTLSGLLPICAHCKKIRDDKGYWTQIESYIHEHSGVEFSHGICQECAKKYYPDMNIYEG